MKLKHPKIKVRIMKPRTKNKILMKALLSVITFFFFFSATTICEDPYISNFYHKGCLSYEHCLFSASSNSDKDSSGELPLPIGHHHVGSSSVHNFTKLESLKPLIQTNTPTLTISSSYSIPESNLAKSIFNPPRTLI